MTEYKMVICMRTDLNMRKGKMISQGAHAVLSSILVQIPFGFPLRLRDWYYEQGQRKICVGVGSEAELLEIDRQAKVFTIPSYVITDSGTTEFHGVPTITCCAIGPERSDLIDTITGHLKLL